MVCLRVWEEEMVRERDIERKLKRRVESSGGLCFKFLSTVSGIPDRLCLFPGGSIVFVELKREGEKPRPLQKRMMEKIRKLGFSVEVIDSEQGIEGLIQMIGGGAPGDEKEEKKADPGKKEEERR